MAYAYCIYRGCGCGLEKPTPEEVVQDSWKCYAGHKNYVRDKDKDRLILDLFDEIADLKVRIDKIENIQASGPDEDD
jgi:hypothetical protein